MTTSTADAPIPFNRPYVGGAEWQYLQEALGRGQLSGNGHFTRKCQAWFGTHYGFAQALLTSSCTDALEMAALLARIAPGDEVILPSYTFVSTANAFVLRGARLVFADSETTTPNIDPAAVAQLITPRTRAVVCVHYGGVACDLDALQTLCQHHGLYLIEDAAQAIEGFHETKNISSGEGGLLAVNAPELAARAEILWEKGTNRAAFFRGEAAKYEWVDVGSSFLPSELTAAFLYAQLEAVPLIQAERLRLWNRYQTLLGTELASAPVQLPVVPAYATHNGNLFYLLTRDLDTRNRLIAHFRSRNIHAVFHYLPLERSPFFAPHHDGRDLPNARRYSDTIVRLPLYMGMTEAEQDRVVAAAIDFYRS
jgi:dTDP-4-amino-4,6-dideoxygalactose transaminase